RFEQPLRHRMCRRIRYACTGCGERRVASPRPSSRESRHHAPVLRPLLRPLCDVPTAPPVALRPDAASAVASHSAFSTAGRGAGNVTAQELLMSFESLGLSPARLGALAELGYTEPTPIQQSAIPLVLAGHDLMA